MIAPPAATCFRQWVILPEKCSGADAIMHAEMNRDIISEPCLTHGIHAHGEIYGMPLEKENTWSWTTLKTRVWWEGHRVLLWKRSSLKTSALGVRSLLCAPPPSS